MYFYYENAKWNIPYMIIFVIIVGYLIYKYIKTCVKHHKENKQREKDRVSKRK